MPLKITCQRFFVLFRCHSMLLFLWLLLHFENYELYSGYPRFFKGYIVSRNDSTQILLKEFITICKANIRVTIFK